jgi:hypothetical protein
VRKTLLTADDEDDRVLETLGVVERHQRDQAVIVAAGIGVGDQCDLGRNASRRSASSRAAARHRTAGDLDQLVEVLDPALGLDRTLRLQPLEVAGLVQDGFEQIADRTSSARSRSDAIVPMKR